MRYDFFTLAGLVTWATVLSAAPDIRDTRMLTQPAVSEKQIAFVYGDDLWIADRDGKNGRRLTTDIGAESNPVFSPDGKSIAFSAQYEGNTDVYLISTEGGAPERLTYHPSADIVRGFTPDGKAVLFSSARHAFAFNGRHHQLFSVPIQGGMPTQLPIPHGFEASYSPDAKFIAYNPNADRSQEWKHYRGGTHGRIWIYQCSDHATVEIPQPKDRCNDLDPNWLGDRVYFRSDRAGEYNLFSFDPKTKQVRQLTTYKDFPIVDLQAGGGQIIFEQAGYLHLFDPKTEKSTRLVVGVSTDLTEARPRFVKGAKYIRNASISPSGARAVFEFRGDIITVPVEKGDPRNVTNSPDAHDRSPAWSPDGKSIAWFSDAGGEYTLRVKNADGTGEAKSFPIKEGKGFYDKPVWSPDAKKLAFVDNSQSLLWIDLSNGKSARIASEPFYGPTALLALRPAWSPDSRYITYALGNKAGYHTVFVHDTTTGKSHPVSDGLSDALDPVFDASGKYLYFLASTDTGPINHWFAQSNNDMRPSRSLYLCVLKKGTPSPFVRESDEERTTPAKKDQPKAKDEPSSSVQIDFTGIDQRIVATPEPAGNYRNLVAGSAGQVFYLDLPSTPGRGDGPPPPSNLKRFDLAKRKSDTVAPGVYSYWLSASGQKALVVTLPDTWAIVDTNAPPSPIPNLGKRLKVDTVEVKIDPRAEWPQILREAWRVNRDYFYDPSMHGADWPAVWKKYEAFLPHLATRGDLDRVIGWMLSELAVGHSRYLPGERLHDRKFVSGGLLGADVEVADGRYRFKKIYGGVNWSPELRSPLTVPGVDAVVGEFLLAVQGREVTAPTELYQFFENTAGKSIEITLASTADGKDRRTVTIEPLASEIPLRNLGWVQDNIKKVHKATDGRVAYVYVPNTTTLGHAYFKRFFFPQCDKEAIIVDERFNGGGQVADYYIDHLRRPFTSMWTTRYGEDFKTPVGAIHGPKVMVIDEGAGSGGDLLPWMFRKYKLGPLVGKRTWGGLVGILGFPVLMDGGMVTAPNLAFWTPEDGFAVENEGVPPDVEVDQWPADVIAGKDPQLEKAIEIALAELKKNPPSAPKRPPFPVRTQK